MDEDHRLVYRLAAIHVLVLEHAIAANGHSVGLTDGDPQPVAGSDRVVLDQHVLVVFAELVARPGIGIAHEDAMGHTVGGAQRVAPDRDVRCRSQGSFVVELDVILVIGPGPRVHIDVVVLNESTICVPHDHAVMGDILQGIIYHLNIARSPDLNAFCIRGECGILYRDIRSFAQLEPGSIAVAAAGAPYEADPVDGQVRCALCGKALEDGRIARAGRRDRHVAELGAGQLDAAVVAALQNDGIAPIRGVKRGQETLSTRHCIDCHCLSLFVFCF